MGITINGGYEKVELKKGPWTREEDQKLLAYVEEHGHGSWRALPAKAGLQRCGKSCRLRWTNYLRPDIKRGKFTSQEEKDIMRLHALLGNRWSAIATHIPKRTDNEIKNYWNTRLKKRLTRMGIDPVTHKRKEYTICGSPAQAAVISHMAQWETARLEAEARLVRESKFLSKLHLLQKLTAPPPPPPLPAVAPPCLDVLKVWQATATATQNRFFGSRGSLESPTSTLNFSMNSYTAAVLPTAGSLMENDVVFVNTNAEAKGKMDNSMQVVHEKDISPNTANYAMDYDYNLAGLMDMGLINYDNNYNPTGTNNNHVGDFEDDDGKNYWNELHTLVSSQMEYHI